MYMLRTFLAVTHDLNYTTFGFIETQKISKIPFHFIFLFSINRIKYIFYFIKFIIFFLNSVVSVNLYPLALLETPSARLTFHSTYAIHQKMEFSVGWCPVFEAANELSSFYFLSRLYNVGLCVRTCVSGIRKSRRGLSRITLLLNIPSLSNSVTPISQYCIVSMVHVCAST